MSNKGHSERNIFGGYDHYDEHGKKIGHSERNVFGGYTNYDEKGHRVGSSDPNIWGGYTQRDNHGRKVGESDPNIFGGYTHRDAKGNRIGESEPNLTGGYRNTGGKQGCYIATCVYGSYDCPEVWTLRRFRDDILRKTAPGRMFIRAYYAVSPSLVKSCGDKRWFRNGWRLFLDRIVRSLKQRGVSDSPYQDEF